jgi:ubiquinone/menaquinone biosynthesis C-methylase UbiE
VPSDHDADHRADADAGAGPDSARADAAPADAAPRLAGRVARWYTEQVVPRGTDLLLSGRRMHPLRRPTVEQATGVVVELGFGSGPNLELYPPEVTRVLAVEPSTVARRRAARRVAGRADLEVRFIGLDGAALALPDRSADTVVSTFTLCTIPDVAAALAEAARVLRPGGRLLFLEHGRSPDPRVRRWQERLDPWQQRLAGGCHLTRDAAELVEAAGFELVDLQRFRIPGPRVLTEMSRGVAVRP